MYKRKKKKPFSSTKFALLLLGGLAGIRRIGRFFFARVARRATKIIMTDPYYENLWEFVSSATRVGPQNIVELNMRAETGSPIERPLGTPKKYPSLDGLLFPFAQLDPMPLQEDEEIDTQVIIGKRAAKPLILKTPILIGGMAYGFAVSEKVRIALAKGAALSGTAASTGQGGLLPKERRVADQLILQYNRGHWGKDLDTLRQADALELHIGQGATGSSFAVLPPQKISRRMAKLFRIPRGKRYVYPSRMPGIDRPEDLVKLVKELRRITEGIPIGVKIGGGDYLERDLAWCLAAEVDYVALGGAEAGSKGSPPTILDDHGLPTLLTLTRAVNYLEKRKARQDLDIIIDGKLITPGDFLKVLALGADAVYIGTAALFAVSHTQVLKALPFEPPTGIVWNIEKIAKKFNVNKGAKSLHLFLKSCAQEMKVSLSMMGKSSLQELSKEDLVALDPFIAEITGVRMAHIPPPEEQPS